MGNDQSAPAPGMAPILAQRQQNGMIPMGRPLMGGPIKSGSFALGEGRSKSDIVTSNTGLPAFQRSSSDIVTSSQMMRDLDNRAAPTLPAISEQPAQVVQYPQVPNYGLGQMPTMAPMQPSPANSFGALTPLETWPPSLSTLGPRANNLQFQSPTVSFNMAPTVPLNMAKPMLAPAPMTTMAPAMASQKRTQATVLGSYANDAQVTQQATTGWSPYASPPAAVPNYAMGGNFVKPQASTGMSPYKGVPAAMSNYGYGSVPQPQTLQAVSSYASLPTAASTQMYGQAPSAYQQPAYQQPSAYQQPYQQPSAYQQPAYQQPFSYSTPVAPMTAGCGYANATATGYGQPTTVPITSNFGQAFLSSGWDQQSRHPQSPFSVPQASYVQQANSLQPEFISPYMQQASCFQPPVSVPQASYMQQAGYPQSQFSVPQASYVQQANPFQPQVSVPQASYMQQAPNFGYGTQSLYQTSASGFSSVATPAPYQAPALPYSAASSAYGFVPPVPSSLMSSGSAAMLPTMMGSFTPSSYAPSSYAPSNAGRFYSSGFPPQQAIGNSGFAPQQAYASSPFTTPFAGTRLL